jgi:glutamate/tyrosine decarboxylase-like PLP-dependent enzyme
MESNAGDRLEAILCEPDEIALKTFFLGPKAENAPLVNDLLGEIFKDWFSWRQELYPSDGAAITEEDKKVEAFAVREQQFRARVAEILHRFRAEIPTFTPRYIGHMVTEISLPALMGHIISLLHNPNNITGEASRVGVQLEDEAIQDLAKMMGYEPLEAQGHFTSGGTVANFEGMLRARSRMARWLALGALAKTQGEDISLFEAAHMGWPRYELLYKKLGVSEDMLKPYHLLRTNPFDVARKLKGIFGQDYDGAVLLVPNNKHYSWEKAVRLIGLGDDAFWPVELDARGKLDANDLHKKIMRARGAGRPVLMVVSVAGTTEMGDFDPIDEVADMLGSLAEHEGLHLWHHVDAAYGGFFCALDTDNFPELSTAMKKALKAIGRSQSLTVDPHKLGFVPYASGAFLCASTREYRAHHIQAPYLDLSRKEDKGPQTIEGSRSAAGAVSTWLTSKIIGLDGQGYGRILSRSIRSRIRVQELLKEADVRYRMAPHGETNILCFCHARDYEPVSVTNRRTQRIYEHFSTRENRDFFVSRTTLTFSAYRKYLDSFLKEWHGQADEQGLTLIRITVLNPFFSSRETGVDYAAEFVQAVQAVLEEEA